MRRRINCANGRWNFLHLAGEKMDVMTRGDNPMRASRIVLVVLALVVQATFAHGDVTTIRTGQVGTLPGVCPGLDDSFHYYAPQTQCGQPILSAPFAPSDFASACSGPPAQVAAPYFTAWSSELPCDPNARWISSGVDPNCYGTSVSALYCAGFDSRCTVADSIRVCWEVDDFLGDQPSYPGPNQDGIYINGVSLGPAFTAGNPVTPTTAVAYNVPLSAGLNYLEVYQRDAGCAVSGLMLSCTVYTSCGPVPIEETSWGRVKSLYR
jgi:hypothetical protein